MNTDKVPSHHLITIPDIVEEKNKICDIRYKDLCLPPGLLLEIEPSSSYEYSEEPEVSAVIADELFENLLKNEKRRRVHKKTRKIRPTKIMLTLKNKL